MCNRGSTISKDRYHSLVTLDLACNSGESTAILNKSMDCIKDFFHFEQGRDYYHQKGRCQYYTQIFRKYIV